MEQLAEEVYADAGQPLDVPADAVVLCERFLGRGCIQPLRADECHRDATLAHDGKRWVIAVRPQLPRHRFDVAVLGELARWILEEQGTEEERSRLAHALLMPVRAFLRVYRRVGPDLGAVAAALNKDIGFVALRLQDITDAVPFDVADPDGPEEYPWLEWSGVHRLSSLDAQLGQDVVELADGRVAAVAAF